jgi:galactofuranose transport system ATP-binding protein
LSGDRILEIRHLSKAFPGVRALSGVDFSLRKGEIHALMGENGAGKSTLIKVLTGVYPRDSGEILFNGKPFSANSPMDAQEKGISTVYQEINMVPNLSVTENLLLGHQPTRLGRIDWKASHERAEAILERLGLELDVRQLLGIYSLAQQQMVAIGRSLELSEGILILDEPTSSLDLAETEQLFAVMRQLRGEGYGIVFVTHFLDQVYQVSDRITVLRNGELVGEFETASLPKAELVAKLLGKALDDFVLVEKEKTRITAKDPKEPILRARRLMKKSSMKAFDLDIRPGEVVGLAGLLGSGRTEIVKLLFGIDKPDQGDLFLRNEKVDMSSPTKALGLGIGLCPEDRRKEGIIEDLSIRENIVLVMQAKRGWFRKIPRKEQQAIAQRYIDMLGIKTPNAEQAVKFLSGGNQQKVILARWLASDPSVLMLDEPTRGIDVGAKAEIQKLILSLSEGGMGILFISSELEEVIRCSTRVAVLRDRKKLTELSGDAINSQSIMRTIAHHEE